MIIIKITPSGTASADAVADASPLSQLCLINVYRTTRQTYRSAPAHHRKHVMVIRCSQNEYLVAPNATRYTENIVASNIGDESTQLISYIYAVSQKNANFSKRSII